MVVLCRCLLHVPIEPVRLLQCSWMSVLVCSRWLPTVDCAAIDLDYYSFGGAANCVNCQRALIQCQRRTVTARAKVQTYARPTPIEPRCRSAVARNAEAKMGGGNLNCGRNEGALHYLPLDFCWLSARSLRALPFIQHNAHCAAISAALCTGAQAARR